MAIITVPTLILLALLLDANIQESFGGNGDADAATKSSFIVLIFGFGFLVLSLLICGCIMHKMGMCLWTKSSRNDDDDDASANDDGTSNQRNNRSDSSANGVRHQNGCPHIIDMPPSYETIFTNEPEHKCSSSDGGTETRSTVVPPPAYESLGFVQAVPSAASSNHI